MITVSATAARASGTPVTFVVPDPEGKLAGVRLRPQVPMPSGRLDFDRHDDGWELVIAAPPVTRMEYLLELRYADGSAQIGPDPANPSQYCGPFGIKSVREFPWLASWRDCFDPHLSGLLRPMSP